MKNTIKTIYEDGDYKVKIAGNNLYVGMHSKCYHRVSLTAYSEIEPPLPVHIRAGASPIGHIRVERGLYRIGAAAGIENKIAELRKIEEQRKAEREEKKGKNLPGLDELLGAEADEDRYHWEFRKMMDDEYNDGVHPPRRPRVSLDRLRQQYPAAAAYLECRRIERSSHWASTRGSHFRAAAERILNGENWEDARAKASEAWSEDAQRAAWNS